MPSGLLSGRVEWRQGERGRDQVVEAVEKLERPVGADACDAGRGGRVAKVVGIGDVSRDEQPAEKKVRCRVDLRCRRIGL